MSRNCHKAAYHGVFLNRLRVEYIYPQIIEEFGIQGGLVPEDVEQVLKTDHDIQAVLVVSPTYDGIVSDVEKIVEICHGCGIPLIVDEAHGAHFGFDPYFPKNANENGADIVTDTNMALAGVNKKELAKYGGEAHCFMAEEEVAKIAKERGVTRATVSMEKAAQIEKPVIFAIGNAPTALIELYEMIQSGSYRPAFIIGVPVGFVNVEAAKDLILKTDVPYIINRGRKGGSNVAAAICNALLYELRDEN